MKESKELFPTDMRKYNSYKHRGKDRLTQPLHIMITPQMERGINILIESGKFPNKSEFIRHLVVDYFDRF